MSSIIFEDDMSNDLKLKEQEELLQLVSFNIGKEEFAVDILKVNEIIRIINITKVPNSPDFIEGVVNLRGKVVPVVDLRIKLGLDRIIQNDNTRIIVFELDKKTIGFKVDSVNEVIRIPKSITEQPPEIVSSINSEYITSIGKLNDRLLILLDIEKILSSNEKQIISN